MSKVTLKYERINKNKKTFFIQKMEYYPNLTSTIIVKDEILGALPQTRVIPACYY